MSSEFSHRPVMLSECLEYLAVRPDGVYLDGTAGGGGHSEEIAKRLVSGRLFAVDKDPDAVAAAGERLKKYGCAQVIEGDYSDAPALLAGRADRLDGALLDLGVSSHQLDCASRGFSYLNDGALDMRMSQSGRTAADLVNGLSAEELRDIIRDYGEEPYAWSIANRIVSARGRGEITATAQLAGIVAAALPPSVRRKDKNPARRTFQALRIAVNDELGALERGLESIFGLLAPGGRFVILTFHSLEDRLVKRFFAEKARGCICPPDFPVCVCGHTPECEILTRRPVSAGEEERESNRRARSAKLRAINKLG